METISICVGSSCYLKGSYSLVAELQKHIAENNLQDKYELKADFCQGNCMNAPCVRIGNRLLTKFAAQDAAIIFE